MPGDLIRHDNFEFKGDTLPLLVDDRGRFASFARACQVMQLNPSAEWVEIQKRAALAANARIEFDSETGEPRFYIRVEAVPMWLGNLPTERIPPAIRAKHTAYCQELIQAVYDFTTTGVAIRAGTPVLEVVQRAAEYLLKIDPSDHARVIASAALASQLALLAGQSAAGELPVTVAYRVQERKLPLSEAEVNRVGALVAAEYRARTGREPEKYMQMIGKTRRPTPVNSYRQCDVPHMDRVVDEFLAAKRRRKAG